MWRWTLVCPWVRTVTWSLEIRVGAVAQENGCQWVLMDAPPSASATQTRIHSLPSMLTPNCRFSEDVIIIKQDQLTVWLRFCLQSNNKSHEKDKPQCLILNRNQWTSIWFQTSRCTVNNWCSFLTTSIQPYQGQDCVNSAVYIWMTQHVK